MSPKDDLTPSFIIIIPISWRSRRIYHPPRVWADKTHKRGIHSDSLEAISQDVSQLSETFLVYLSYITLIHCVTFAPRWFFVGPGHERYISRQKRFRCLARQYQELYIYMCMSFFLFMLFFFSHLPLWKNEISRMLHFLLLGRLFWWMRSWRHYTLAVSELLYNLSFWFRKL